MTWKRNVFFCNWSRWPEKRMYFFVTEVNVLKKERIFVKLKSMSWKKNVFFSLLQEKAWKRTYCLCLKRKRIFCKSSQNFYPIEENVHPNETKPPCNRKPEWKRIFVPENKTYFSAKVGKISPQSKKMFTQRKQNTAWERTYFLCLKRKRIFLRKQAKVLPNWGEFSLKGNQAHLEITSGTWFASQVPKERTYCLIFQNNLKCGARNSVRTLRIEQGRYVEMQWRNLYFNILNSFSFVCFKLQTPLYKRLLTMYL